MKTFEETWTVETVKEILEEYTQSNTDFLCKGSKKFKEIWESHRGELRKLVFKWKPVEKEFCPQLETGCLTYLEPWNAMTSVRLAFLNHEIERLTK